MKSQKLSIYGIGNPLIDIVIQAKEEDLNSLNLDKGVMHLVDETRQKEIINYFNDSNPKYFPGGSAPNTLLACAGFGISSLIAGKIGQDAFGNIYLQQAEKFGVISGLVQGNGPTGSSIILVTPDGERTMNTHLGMCKEFSENDVDARKLSESSYFYFTGYMWDTEPQKSAIKKAITIAKENNVKIVFDVADPFAVDRNKDDFLQMIKNDVDVVFANQAELAILFGMDNVNSSANELMKIVHRAGIKLGKKGSLVLDDGKKLHLPPQPISAIDSTGAGDMYAAGFLASISKDYSSKRAGEIGGLLAEEIIQQTGAQFEVDKINVLRSKFFE
jgi:sugar/nucleoside kinase (ribokinase family)